jgi:hypothetical protein
MSHKVLYNKGYGEFKLSDEVNRKLCKLGIDPHSVKRHDVRLISIVEEIGLDKASGPLSNLRIETIDCDLYYIYNYNGFESIVPMTSHNWINATHS